MPSPELDSIISEESHTSDEKQKNRKKTFSVSLTPNDVENIKKLGYNLTDVAKIGVETVIFKKSFLVSYFPSISIEVGLGLLLFSFSVILSKDYIGLSYLLLFTSLLFITMASVTSISLLKISKLVNRRKDGKSK